MQGSGERGVGFQRKVLSASTVRAARASRGEPDRAARRWEERHPRRAAAPRTATRPAHARPTPQGSGLPSPGRRRPPARGPAHGVNQSPAERGDRRQVGGAVDGAAADDDGDVGRQPDQRPGRPATSPSSRGLPAGRRPPPYRSRGGRRRRSCWSTRRRTASRSSGRRVSGTCRTSGAALRSH